MKKTSKHRYEIILYWSDEDQAYIAEVPELEWCAADGETYHDAIEKGWTIPEPKGRRLVYA